MLDRRIQELGTLQSKNQEFIFKVFVTLHGELLNKQLKQSQTIVDLQTEIEKNTESYLRHLDNSATSNNQLLQTEQDKATQLLRELNSRDELNTQLTAENLTLKRRLEQSEAGNQTLIEDGEKTNYELQLRITKHNEGKVRELFEKEETKNKDLIGELRSNNKITEELRELTRFCEQNHAAFSTCENRAQFYRIEALEKENEELRCNMPFDFSRCGTQAGTGAGVDQSNLFANVTLKDLETSLVKGLGELFTREDKKNIRVFRCKPSDPPITSWLKAFGKIR